MLDGLREAAKRVVDDRTLRSLLTDCHRLLSERGEANSASIARDLVSRFNRVARGPARHLLRAPGDRLQPRSAGGAAERAGLREQPERGEPGPPRPARRAAAPGAAAAASTALPGGTASIVAMRRALLPRLPTQPELQAARGRLPAPAVELVQPGLPRAAAGRLELARAAARADHPARVGACDRRLGRPAPAPAAGPPLLRVLPPAAAGRAADLRRGRAAAGDAGGDRAADRQEGDAAAAEHVQGRGVLFDQQLPARPARRVARQLPDQARRRDAAARAAAAADLLHAVADPRLRRAGCAPAPSATACRRPASSTSTRRAQHLRRGVRRRPDPARQRRRCCARCPSRSARR